MMVESGAEMGRMIRALAILNGLDHDADLARAVSEAGFEISQQSVNNYKRGRKPPLGFVVAFVKAVDLGTEQRRELLRAYMEISPELEDFLRLWASL